MLDLPALTRAMQGLRRRLSPRRQRRRPLRHRASAEGPRAEHDRDLQRARGDARERDQADRVFVAPDRSTASPRVSDAGGRAVSRPDLALRRVEARRRRADRGLLRGLRLRGLHLPLRVDPRRALHARPRLRLLQAASAAIRPGCGCSATASSGSRTSTSRTASTRCSWRWRRRAGQGQRSSTSAPTSTARSTTRSAGSANALGRESRARRTPGGDRGWIGDNPFIFLDTAKIRALGWQPKLTIREGDHPDARLPAGEPLGCWRRAHEGLRRSVCGTSAR